MVREEIVFRHGVLRGTHSSPIIQTPDWKFPFETSCYAYDHAVGTVPVQCKDNQHYDISYESKTLTGVQ